MTLAKPVKITEVVLRDAHQSLMATRMTMDDMLPILGANHFSILDELRRPDGLLVRAALDLMPGVHA